MKKYLYNIEHLNNISFWLIIFFYALLTSLLIQLLILPVFFPNWCDTNGLLNGGDYQSFHQLAVTVSGQIKMQGWGAWNLRPEGQSPAGVAAILYTLFLPKPWVLVPLNAFLHATASLVLLKILRIVLQNRKAAIIGVLPFTFFPTTFLWLAQIHKDGFSILGNLLILLSLLLFLDCRWKPPFSEELKALLLFWLGVILIWIPRPYQLQILQGELVLIAILILTLTIIRQKKLFWQNMITPFVIIILMVAISPLSQNLGIDEQSEAIIIMPQVESPQIGLPKVESPQIGLPQIESPQIGLPKVGSPQIGSPQIGLPQVGSPQVQYQRTPWIPTVLENLFSGLSRIREEYFRKYPNAASKIDTNIHFTDALQIFAYLPRAVEIALLAPFPSDWFRQGSLASTTMMRRVAAVEMTFVYFSLICFLLFFLKYIKKTEIWVIVAFCLGIMIVYTLSNPNVGTLYRMRYGFIMVLVGLGVGFIINANWLARQKTH